MAASTPPLDPVALAIAKSRHPRSSVTSAIAGDTAAAETVLTDAGSVSSDSAGTSPRSAASDGAAKAAAADGESVSSAPFGPWPGPLSPPQEIFTSDIQNSVRFGVKDHTHTPSRCIIAGADSGESYTLRHQGPTPLNYVITNQATNHHSFPIHSVAWGIGASDPSQPDAYYSRSNDENFVYLSYVNKLGAANTWSMSAAEARDLSWSPDNTRIAGALAHGTHGSFIVWTITGITVTAKLHVATDWCMGCDFCPDHTQDEVAVCSLDGHLLIFHSPIGPNDFVLKYDIDVMAGPLFRCEYHPSGDYVYTASGTGEIVCYWVRTATPPPHTPFPPVVEVFRYPVPGIFVFDLAVVEVNGHTRIALATSKGLMIFDQTSMSIIADLQIPAVTPGVFIACRSVAWSWDGTEVVAGWGDHHMRIYLHGAWPPPGPPVPPGPPALKDGPTEKPAASEGGAAASASAGAAAVSVASTVVAATAAPPAESDPAGSD